MAAMWELELAFKLHGVSKNVLPLQETVARDHLTWSKQMLFANKYSTHHVYSTAKETHIFTLSFYPIENNNILLFT